MRSKDFDVLSQQTSLLAGKLKTADDTAVRQIGEDALALLRRIESAYEYDLISLHGFQHSRDYSNWAREYFGSVLPYPAYPLAISFTYGSEWGDRFLQSMMGLIAEFEWSLIRDIAARKVPGAVAEFGVFQGYMLGKLIEECERIGYDTDVYGFDSFEGLSEPSGTYDHAGWKAGQFAADYGKVCESLRLDARPKLKLVKGFFDESLKRPDVQAIREIAYARIDCDIYSPAVDCLEYLGPRLSDGAILVFDDWVYDLDKGETKAFYEWLPKVPHLKFEFIAFLTCRFYLRVTRV